MAIDLKPNYLKIVKEILNKYIPECEVWVFGSRTRKDHHPYSDLDLLLQNKKPISLATLGHLSEEFAESDLPFTVDLIDWHRISDEFRKSIQKHRERL